MQDSGSLAVFKITARDQGHYTGPSGAFVTYCNISCLCVWWGWGVGGGREGEGGGGNEGEMNTQYISSNIYELKISVISQLCSMSELLTFSSH